MEKLKEFFEKSHRINLALFLCSFGIYFLYFHSIFFAINSTLSSITADSLKNYYTFVYHVKNDANFLNFSGMNYPYGEHIIYTDCQPILTFILRMLPFTHTYLVGILHGLMFFSFIISPLILNKLFYRLGIDKFSSFFFSLAIALLSPQFLKINAGHFALAYGCVIPLSLLFTVNYLNEKKRKNLLILFVFNSLLFFLHPYIGFCLSIFTFLSLFLSELLNFNKKTFIHFSFKSMVAGVFPLAVFKVFMLFTDHHSDRTTEPYGAEVMIENLDSIIAPVFGPFQKPMEYFFSNRPFHFEGHTYLGFFTILLFVTFICCLPFLFKKLKIKKEVLVIFLASLFFLFLSFGIHLTILDYFHLKSAALNQFRAVCRFSWIFYFTLPVFLISVLYQTFKNSLSPGHFAKVTFIIPLLFFGFNLLEANSYFRLNEVVYWKYRNFFNENYLNDEEKKILAEIRNKEPQAILPLPLFHGGSEMYDRLGSNNSMIPSMIYSYHSGIPIASVLMSRTSLTETKELIGLLNSYKKEKPIEKLISTKDFFVLTTHDPLLPDETRLISHVKQFDQNDSLKYGFVSVKELLRKKISKTVYSLHKQNLTGDTADVIFIDYENHKPFLSSKILDYETIFHLDSNKINSGAYVVSFHYYYTKTTYQALACNLIINRVTPKASDWQYNLPVRCLSGFYPGFAVFEYRIELDKKNKYDFMLKGFEDETYRISSFLLRPEHTDVEIINSKDTVYNNFPN